MFSFCVANNTNKTRPERNRFLIVTNMRIGPDLLSAAPFNRTAFFLRLISIAMVGIFAHAAAAQATPQPDDNRPVTTMSVKVNVVNLLATVRDKHGQIVHDLTKDDFMLSEHGRPQSIHYFTKESDPPLILGLLVDTSMSQRRVLDQERSASH